jgi:hypothetical protein
MFHHSNTEQRKGQTSVEFLLSFSPAILRGLCQTNLPWKIGSL